MHSLYVFDLLTTASLELKEELEGLDETVLDKAALADLAQYRRGHDSLQDIYVMHYEGQPKYVDKANNVSDRLSPALDQAVRAQRH